MLAPAPPPETMLSRHAPPVDEVGQSADFTAEPVLAAPPPAELRLARHSPAADDPVGAIGPEEMDGRPAPEDDPLTEAIAALMSLCRVLDAWPPSVRRVLCSG